MEDRVKVVDSMTLEPESVRAIGDRAGFSETKTRTLLKGLVLEGIVLAEQNGKSTKYRLPEPEKKRGPRRKDAQARDDRVLELVTSAGRDGVTKYEVADSLDITPDAAYLSLWRLVKAGTVVLLPSGTRRPTYATRESVEG